VTEADRNLLVLLKFEHKFLKDGGYGRSPRTPWRATAIFEDSPICPNFCDPARPFPCANCQLTEFAPEDLRSERAPCRFIPLTAEGVTVDDLYRTGSQAEMEAALGQWLLKQIQKIERDGGLKPETGAA
jgi:hypothetical protein